MAVLLLVVLVVFVEVADVVDVVDVVECVVVVVVADVDAGCEEVVLEVAVAVAVPGTHWSEHRVSLIAFAKYHEDSLGMYSNMRSETGNKSLTRRCLWK